MERDHTVDDADVTQSAIPHSLAVQCPKPVPRPVSGAENQDEIVHDSNDFFTPCGEKLPRGHPYIVGHPWVPSAFRSKNKNIASLSQSSKSETTASWHDQNGDSGLDGVDGVEELVAALRQQVASLQRALGDATEACTRRSNALKELECQRDALIVQVDDLHVSLKEATRRANAANANAIDTQSQLHDVLALTTATESHSQVVRPAVLSPGHYNTDAYDKARSFAQELCGLCSVLEATALSSQQQLSCAIDRVQTLEDRLSLQSRQMSQFDAVLRMQQSACLTAEAARDEACETLQQYESTWEIERSELQAALDVAVRGRVDKCCGCMRDNTDGVDAENVESDSAVALGVLGVADCTSVSYVRIDRPSTMPKPTSILERASPEPHTQTPMMMGDIHVLHEKVAALEEALCRRVRRAAAQRRQGHKGPMIATTSRTYNQHSVNGLMK